MTNDPDILDETPYQDTARYLDVDRASVYLSLSVDSLYRRVSDRTIPFIKVGRRVLFDKAALDDWMADHANATGD